VCNTPRRLLLAPLLRDSSTNDFQFTAFLEIEFHYRLDIIFNLEMVSDIERIDRRSSKYFSLLPFYL